MLTELEKAALEQKQVIQKTAELEEQKIRPNCHSGRKCEYGCIHDLSPREVDSLPQFETLNPSSALNYNIQYPDLSDIGNMNIEQVSSWLARISYSVYYGLPQEVQNLSYNDSIRYLAELIVLNHQFKSNLSRVSEANSRSEASSAFSFRSIDSAVERRQEHRSPFSVPFSANSCISPHISPVHLSNVSANEPVILLLKLPAERQMLDRDLPFSTNYCLDLQVGMEKLIQGNGQKRQLDN